MTRRRLRKVGLSAVTLLPVLLAVAGCGLGNVEDGGTPGTKAKTEEVPGRVATVVRLLVDLAILDPQSAALLPALGDPIGIRLPDRCENADGSVTGPACELDTEKNEITVTMTYSQCQFPKVSTGSAGRQLDGSVKLVVQGADCSAFEEGSTATFQPESATVTLTNLVDHRFDEDGKEILRLTWPGVEAGLDLKYPDVGEDCSEQPNEISVRISTGTMDVEGLRANLTGTVTYEKLLEQIQVDLKAPGSFEGPCQAESYTAIMEEGTVTLTDSSDNAFVAVLDSLTVSTGGDRSNFSVTGGRLSDPSDSACLGGPVSVKTASQVTRSEPQVCPIGGELTVGAQDSVKFTATGGLEIKLTDGTTCTQSDCTDARACKSPRNAQCQVATSQ